MPVHAYWPPMPHSDDLTSQVLHLIQADHYGREDDPHLDAAREHAAEQVALKARDLVRAVDRLPKEKQPVGWSPVTPPKFELVEYTEPSADAPDLSDFECRCPDPDDQYLMEVDCGSVDFRHAACGKRPGSWADDAFGMQPVAVTLRWHSSRDRWTGEVDAYGDVTVNGLEATGTAATVPLEPTA